MCARSLLDLVGQMRSCRLLALHHARCQMNGGGVGTVVNVANVTWALFTSPNTAGRGVAADVAVGGLRWNFARLHRRNRSGHETLLFM
jgi:hypothetical protein